MRNLSILIILVLYVVPVTIAQNISTVQDCNSCHTQTFKQWSKSRHAKSAAVNSPIYKAMLNTRTTENIKACQTCHEPVAALDQTGFVSKSLVNQGVNCDVCHAFKVEEKHKKLEFVPVEGNKKLGPYDDAISTMHQHEYSKVLSDSKSCIVCHNNRQNPHGVGFIDTEAEWKKSEYYKNDIECQDCHLPAISGKTAELGKIRDKVYSHRFWGGFNKEMIQNSISLDLDVNKVGNQFELLATLENLTAGHNIPTGSPLRMLVLLIEAHDDLGQTVWKNYYYNPIKESPKSVFMKLLKNGNGESPAFPWEAAGEVFDSRLEPQKEKIVKYQIPAANIQSIKATLEYHIAPPPLLRIMGIVDDDFKSKPIATAFYRID